MAALAAVASSTSSTQKSETTGLEIIKNSQTSELVFCVVGHIGSGTSKIAESLKGILESKELGYSCSIIKATDLIDSDNNIDFSSPLDRVSKFQDAGDSLRIKDQAIIARRFIREVRKTRALSMGIVPKENEPVTPDDTKRAYILDSVKHPQEIELLRNLYKGAFIAIGVVCDEDIRKERVKDKLDCSPSEAIAVMKRDAKISGLKNGQRVSDTFHLSDFFVNNTEEETVSGTPNPNWEINDHLLRLLKIILRKQIIRPTLSETAMFHAFGACLKSACLSRQVGAALVTKEGEVISTGKNEVPKAGGGTYGECFSIDKGDHDERCFVKPHFDGITTHPNPYCSNTVEQNSITDEIYSEISDLLPSGSYDQEELREKIKNTRVAGLIEFSRAIHAEMDAILSALRQGKKVEGSKLFVTTFPCHYCARHIVTAGIDEVQYIEPYPKSLAYKLHRDAISHKAEDNKYPSEGGTKVVFKPFSGVAPRLYRIAFEKDRDLKDKETGYIKIESAEWGESWASSKSSIYDIESRLASEL